MAMAIATGLDNKIFRFSLAEPDRVYTSGDKVHGRLHVDPSERAVTVTDLVVRFRGKITQTVRSERAQHDNFHYGKVYLFSFSKTLLAGEHSIDKPVDFDLEFEFPWHPYSDESQQNYRAHERFLGEAGPRHRLPPSCAFNYGAPTRIRYYFEVDYDRTGQILQLDSTEKISVVFCPALQAPTAPAPTNDGTPARLDFQSGILQKAKKVLGNNASAVFQVSASAPAAISIGAALPVDLHLKFDGEASTASEAPPVTISEVDIKIIDHSRTRVPSINPLDKTEDGNEQTLTLTRRSFAPPVAASDGMALNNQMPITMRRQIGPSFVTFSVAREFRLEIRITFQCNGKSQQVLVLRAPLEIYPPWELHRDRPFHLPDPTELNGAVNGHDALPNGKETSEVAVTRVGADAHTTHENGEEHFSTPPNEPVELATS